MLKAGDDQGAWRMLKAGDDQGAWLMLKAGDDQGAKRMEIPVALTRVQSARNDH